MKVFSRKAGERIGYFLKKDFDFVQNFYLSRIEALKSGLRKHHNVLEIAKEAFYLSYYVEDMTHFGWPDITKSLRKSFQKESGDSRILETIQKDAFTRFLDKATGQQSIGENSYIIQDKMVYHRTLDGRWYTIAPDQVFLLLPARGKEVHGKQRDALEAMYSSHEEDHLYRQWCTLFSTCDSSTLLFFRNGTITPEEYATHAFDQIRQILACTPNYESVRELCTDADISIEDIFRVCYKLVRFVLQFRIQGIHPVYILRDGMMFAEAHAALDILTNNKCPHTEVMIGRKLLSGQQKPEFYWRLVVDVLYDALEQESHDFTRFSLKYASIMSEKEIQYPRLKQILNNLSRYLQEKLKNIRKKQKIISVDTGLQGSVNMIIKYLIDRDGHFATPSDIHMFVVGAWFKGIYKQRFTSHYYPMMKDIEILSRSEHVYAYKPGSFESGKIKVDMGSHEQQLKANIELIVLTMVCFLMHKNKRV